MSHHRRSNPGMGDMLMGAAKAAVGGTVAAVATFGAVKLGQKIPAKTKAGAVVMLSTLAVGAGGALGAVGLPAAGTVVAAGLAGAALQTAMTPSQVTAAPPVNGVIRMRGLINGVARHAPDRRLADGDSYDRAMATADDRQISGLLRKFK